MTTKINISILSNNLAIVTENKKDRFILDDNQRAKLDEIIYQLQNIIETHDKNLYKRC